MGVDAVERAPAQTPDLSRLISAIGEDDLGTHLITFLNRICGAEYCTIFELDPDEPSKVEAASLDGTNIAHRQAKLYLGRECWRRDPIFLEAQRRASRRELSVLRLDMSTLTDPELRDVIFGRVRIRDRILLCGEANGQRFGLSILRSERFGEFSAAEMQLLDVLGETLLSVIAKHAGVRRQMSSMATALTSLTDIERCILASPHKFPRREAEVCARILYGLTSVGIGLDLGIGEETVMTYRKRAYQRLQIGSHRELLLWYLKWWSVFASTNCKAQPEIAAHPSH